MDEKVKYEERYDVLVKIIESFESLEKSKEWEVLKEHVFSKSLISIERQLLNASIESPIVPEKIYKLQGELSWARRFNDVSRFIETYKKQLVEAKSKINE